jgi:hypothetical protein
LRKPISECGYSAMTKNRIKKSRQE